MKKSIYIAFLFSLVTIVSYAQADKHNSLFFGNALMTNPAAAGMSNGDARFFMSYRNQWASVSTTPYNTMSFAVDVKTFDQKIKDGFVGMGMTFYNSQAGEGKFTRSNFNFDLSYAMEVQKDLHLSFGASGGFGQYKINYDNFNWGVQWVGDGYDNTKFNQEPFYDEIKTVFDLAAGVYLQGRLSPNVDLHGGIAINNIIKPEITFINADDKLYRHVSLSFHPEIRMPNTKLGFVPGVFVFKQGPNQELTIGTEVKYFLQESSHYTGYYEEKSISIGSFFRTGDAVLVTGGFNYAGITAGLGYDLNISSLKTATNGMGGFEFFLRYRIGFSYGYGRR